MTRRLAPLFETAGFAFLACLAAALPWELFQRVPFTGMTLAKLCGSGAIGCAAGLVISRRTFRYSMTGLELPIGLFALICVGSLIGSLDRTATLDQLTVYVTYLASLAAFVVLIPDVRRARLLLVAYMASTGAVAVLALACSAGLFWPTLWQTSTWPIQPMLDEYRSGVTMRMVAASEDLNQGVVPALIAFASSLFLFDRSRGGTLGRVLRVVYPMVLAGAVLVAMSRSALAIMGALLALRLFWGMPSRWRVSYLVGILLASAALGWLLGREFWDTFTHRAQGGVVVDDGSARGRIDVYLAALAVAKDYWAVGAGLGASDAAMLQSAYRDRAVMTVHSMPLKFLIELGLPGLFAYFWIMIATFRNALTRFAHSDDETTAPYGRALVAMGTALVAFTFVQPFPFLPVYPLMLAFVFGPRVDESSLAGTRPYATRWPISLGIAIAQLVAMVNLALYQTTARQVEAYADALRAGITAEQSGDAAGSHRAYTRALSLSSPALQTRPYYDVASDVIDVEAAFGEMGIYVRDANPSAVATWGLTRLALSSGAIDESNSGPAVWDLDVRFAPRKFDMAEMLWQHGVFDSALQLYAEAAQLVPTPLSSAESRRIARLELRLGAGSARPLLTPEKRQSGVLLTSLYWEHDGQHYLPEDLRQVWLRDRLDSLLGAEPTEAVLLERASILRKLGRWPESVAQYRQAVAQNPACADALYHLGLDAELRGTGQAERLYAQAIAAMPEHAGAAGRLSRIEGHRKSGN